MTTPSKLYFISDLHIGGEGVLNKFEAEKEFIDFLKKISKNNKDRIELIIVGDFFDLWEIQSKEGLEKFKHLEKSYQKLLKTIKEASKKIKITLIPGNHDHELACFKEYPDLLKKYGINLIQKPSTERNFFGKKIWIEHGNQLSRYNRFENFGNVLDKPYGYYINKDIFNRIVNVSQNNNKKSWLSDLPYFSFPYQDGPFWFASNYFYKELAPILRYLVTPFLMLFSISLIILLLAVLDKINVIDIPNIFYLTSFLGPIRYIVNIVIVYNFILIALFFIFWVLFQLTKKDIRSSLLSYGIDFKYHFRTQGKDYYITKIKDFLRKNPQYDMFILGDEHVQYLFKTKVKGKKRTIGNCGAWVKSFNPIRSWFRMPRVFIPYYKLSYFVMEKKGKEVVVSLKFWPKKAEYSLTLLQKISIMFKKREVELKEKKAVI
ncbi:MAG: hypothetical protein GF335_02890 [Candidatus Moranbacteria bacterium]|nr:hypothetical protein [Candidatus Moranbacteria bacterium]